MRFYKKNKQMQKKLFLHQHFLPIKVINLVEFGSINLCVVINKDIGVYAIVGKVHVSQPKLSKIKLDSYSHFN